MFGLFRGCAGRFPALPTLPPATRLCYIPSMTSILPPAHRARPLVPRIPLPLAGLALVLAIAAAKPGTVAAEPAGDWEPLYKGTLDDFRIYFRGTGYIDDVQAQHVYVAEPGQIHVRQSTNGVIVTKVPYSHYHVKVDYRWGAEGGSKNAGLMAHVDLASKAVKDNRPKSIEINMRHDSPGSIWLASGLGPFASTFIEKDTRRYLPEERGGVPHDATPFGDRTIYGRYENDELPTKPYGEWNTMEAIVRGSESLEIIVNGQTVTRLYTMRDPLPGTQDPGPPLTEGGIGLQSEGQEIFYRNFVVRNLTP